MVKFAAVLALLSASVLCLTAAYSLNTVNKHLSATLMKLDTEIDEAHRLTLEAGLTVMEARKASAKEIVYLDAWNSGIARTLTDLHEVMLSTNQTVLTANDTLLSARVTIVGLNGVTAAAVGTLGSATTTLSALQSPITQLNSDLAALQPVIAHTDALVSNPALTTTISNVASTTGHLDATAADVQQEVHSLTHPTWLHRIWGGLLDVAHVFNPL